MDSKIRENTPAKKVTMTERKSYSPSFDVGEEIKEIYSKKPVQTHDRFNADLNTTAATFDEFRSPAFTIPSHSSPHRSPVYLVKGTGIGTKSNVTLQLNENGNDSPTIVPFVVNGRSSPTKLRQVAKDPLRNGLPDQVLPSRNDAAAAVASALGQLSFHAVSQVPNNIKHPKRPIFTSYGVGRHIFGKNRDVLPTDVLQVTESLQPKFGKLAAGQLGRALYVDNINYHDPECTFTPEILKKSRSDATKKTSEHIKTREEQKIARQQAEAALEIARRHDRSPPKNDFITKMGPTFAVSLKKQNSVSASAHVVAQMNEARVVTAQDSNNKKCRVAGKNLNVKKEPSSLLSGYTVTETHAPIITIEPSASRNESRKALAISKKKAKMEGNVNASYVSRSMVDDFFGSAEPLDEKSGVKFEQIVLKPTDGVVLAANLVGVRAPAQLITRTVVDYEVSDDEFNFTKLREEKKEKKNRKSTIEEARKSIKNASSAPANRKSSSKKETSSIHLKVNNVNQDTSSMVSGSSSSILPPNYVRPVFSVTHVSPPRVSQAARNLASTFNM
eukprot:GDKJ01028562.1.p1 GENE.GDKJ01028562.1~~GDKJ01028562.1.p1  ORF type:complete len:587 (+),score=118.58 GDKJ01028562.1:85-1761(+)